MLFPTLILETAKALKVRNAILPRKLGTNSTPYDFTYLNYSLREISCHQF